MSDTININGVYKTRKEITAIEMYNLNESELNWYYYRPTNQEWKQIFVSRSYRNTQYIRQISAQI